ncbi:hypothetical protein B0A54_05722 [Friedmanniomyces endolithicus]|uniref:histone acetyltransferase n=1 Tax=Friedmanniomyces endolithicus TaxID=329885 RepID=A0A4U0V3K9_9PEZI|nr:hypothetical protein B0A54_05722 [Friedmanniomyces endolithicus]
MANMTSASPLSILSPNRSSSKPQEPNVANVVMGNLHIRPWYPSFYPEDMVGGRKTEWLYKVCPLKDTPPPGETVYDKDDYIIHEIDGEDHGLYAQNLSLFSKLFLETKSVFFDVSTFLYYILILRNASHPYGQVVGFFSKEKMSWDNNNVACILVFPPWQRRGLGQILIAVSYEFGKREGRFGGPERPLSALGRKGYLGFWCGEVYRFLLRAPLKRTLTVRDISEGTYVMQEDVVAALKEMDVLEKRKTAAGSIVVNKSKLRAWAERHGVSREPVVDVDAFVEAAEEGSEMEE